MTTSSARHRPLLAALALPLLLQSCFTMGLWGFYPEDVHDPVRGTTEAGLTYDGDTEWSWSLFGLRVLATPFTLGLDCLTMPVQVFLWGDDDCADSR